MKNKGALLLVVDLVNTLLLLGLAATGSIVRWILPAGSGGRRGGHAGESCLGLTRHGWGDVHFWIAVGLLVGIAVHLLLHAGWIGANWRKYVRLNRSSTRHLPRVAAR